MKDKHEGISRLQAMETAMVMLAEESETHREALKEVVAIIESTDRKEEKALLNEVILEAMAEAREG